MNKELKMHPAIDKVIKKDIELLSTKEAAKLIGAEESTLRTWRCTKKENIPFHKIGKKVLYSKSDLLEWLNGRRVA